MSQPEVFQDGAAMKAAQAKLATLEQQLEEAFERWEILEAKHQAWLNAKNK